MSINKKLRMKEKVFNQISKAVKFLSAYKREFSTLKNLIKNLSMFIWEKSFSPGKAYSIVITFLNLEF